MLKTLSLFDDETEEVFTQKTKIIRTPTVKKRLVEVLESKADVPYEKEVMRLILSTDNRPYKKEFLYMEKEQISKSLKEGLEKSGKQLEIIVDTVELILKTHRNLYVTQAIEFATDGDSFKIIKEFLQKPSLGTKKIIHT